MGGVSAGHARSILLGRVEKVPKVLVVGGLVVALIPPGGDRLAVEDDDLGCVYVCARVCTCVHVCARVRVHVHVHVHMAPPRGDRLLRVRVRVRVRVSSSTRRSSSSWKMDAGADAGAVERGRG